MPVSNGTNLHVTMHTVPILCHTCRVTRRCQILDVRQYSCKLQGPGVTKGAVIKLEMRTETLLRRIWNFLESFVRQKKNTFIQICIHSCPYCLHKMQMNRRRFPRTGVVHQKVDETGHLASQALCNTIKPRQCRASCHRTNEYTPTNT